MWLVTKVEPWSSLRAHPDTLNLPMEIKGCKARGFCVVFDRYDDALEWVGAGCEDWLLEMVPLESAAQEGAG